MGATQSQPPPPTVIPRLHLRRPDSSCYGQHVSRGFPALAFLQGPLGTWRPVVHLRYNCNYYARWGTPAHPFDFAQVIADASHPPRMTTARDADGILLADFDEDGEIDWRNDRSDSGEALEPRYVFVEHWGIGEDSNRQQSAPFCHAWFDDNYIARLTMRVYRADDSEPYGLYKSHVHPRFSVFAGDDKHDPYPLAFEDPAQYPDQITLHALHLANNGKWHKVEKAFGLLIDASGAKLNKDTKLFDYIKINDFYHLCDMKILFQRLFDSGLKFSRPGFTSWKTGVKSGDGSLINTETTVFAMLALSAGVLWTFEPSEWPMSPTCEDELNVLFVRRRCKNGRVGIIANGPFVNIPTGDYSASFNVRVFKVNSESLNEKVVSARILDRGQILSETEYATIDLIDEFADEEYGKVEGWKQAKLPKFSVCDSENVLEFQVTWLGGADVDFGSLCIF
ncbi:hypothetical protein HDU84_006348 [Entophlyctis sp. JEL0112]|nr:hypothetical protein HDU84_006348 [Entophlyctis sp. JEL0112]